jgi:hypothetical protein
MQGESEFQRQFDETRQRLETLRDEIRLKIHLASMDTKEAFRDMESQIHHFERVASHTAQTALLDLAHRLEELALHIGEENR